MIYLLAAKIHILKILFSKTFCSIMKGLKQLIQPFRKEFTTGDPSIPKEAKIHKPKLKLVSHLYKGWVKE